VKLPVFDRIHPQSKKFATGVESKATSSSLSSVLVAPSGA